MFYPTNIATLLANDNLFFVGIDGGATNCRASIFNAEGTLLASGRSGSANPVNGVEKTLDSILQAVNSAVEHLQRADIGLANLVVGAGLAGLALPAMQQALAKWQHPFYALYITTDTYVATLGAHEGEDGAIIILGTGFSALAIVKGKEHPVGGHGFPIGATCSGSWFGLEAVKAVLLDIDKLGPATSLTKELLCDISLMELVERMNNALAPEFARYAPAVFKHAQDGDNVAQSLIAEGAKFIDQVITRLLSFGVSRIAFVGSIAPHIVPHLKQSYQPHIVRVKSSPEQGAMMFARSRFIATKK